MSTATSVLFQSLEPILGFAFALNLAYIGLPRFRYREQIREAAQKSLKEITAPSEAIKATGWYSAVARLTLMPNNSDGVYKSAKLPEFDWANHYRWVFEKHRDRRSVIGICILIVVLNVIGTAHSINYLDAVVWGISLKAPFVGWMVHVWFWVIVFAMIVPVFFVWLGRRTALKACSWAESSVRDGKKTLQAAVKEVALPEGIQGAESTKAD